MTTKTVWKFKLERKSPVIMPSNGQLLYAKEQGGGIFIWALVNPTNKTVERHFKIYNTGDDILDSDKLEYFGTAMRNSGNRVHHVFEVIT